MRRCLEDSDSSFDSYSSVGSDKIDKYDSIYGPMIRNQDGTKKKPVQFKLHLKSKEPHKSLTQSTKSNALRS